MEMPAERAVAPVPNLRPAARAGWLSRALANRRLWKSAIYTIALVTYLCSFLFFGLAVADVRQGNSSGLALIYLLVATYFLVQVIFLFVLSGVVERRRRSQPIAFPDRRAK